MFGLWNYIYIYIIMVYHNITLKHRNMLYYEGRACRSLGVEGLGSAFPLPQEQGINNQSAKQRCSSGLGLRV